MVQSSTLELIATELRTLSKENDVPVPKWKLIAGTTSAFVHDTEGIEFAAGSLEQLEREKDVVDIVGLIAHEFKHYLDFVNDVNQNRPNTREANARRFAKKWAERRFPNRIDELDFQDLTPSLAMEPTGPGLDPQVIGEDIERRFANLTPIELQQVEESLKPRGRPVSTSLWIRTRLFRGGPGHPYGLWKEFHDIIKKIGYEVGGYDTFRTLLWVLNRKLGFIRRVHKDGKPVTEESDFGDCCDRHPYEIVPQFERDDRWNAPLKAVYG